MTMTGVARVKDEKRNGTVWWVSFYRRVASKSAIARLSKYFKIKIKFILLK